MISLHVFPQKLQVAIRLLFKFIGGYAAKCTFFMFFFHFFLLKPTKMTCKLCLLLPRFPICTGFGSHDMVFLPFPSI